MKFFLIIISLLSLSIYAQEYVDNQTQDDEEVRLPRFEPLPNFDDEETLNEDEDYTFEEEELEPQLPQLDENFTPEKRYEISDLITTFSGKENIDCSGSQTIELLVKTYSHLAPDYDMALDDFVREYNPNEIIEIHQLDESEIKEVSITFIDGVNSFEIFYDVRGDEIVFLSIYEKEDGEVVDETICRKI